MTPLHLALSALQEIAESAIRCEPCGLSGRPGVDAVASYWRESEEMFISVMACRECLARETKLGLDGHAPFQQPPHVLRARLALKQIAQAQRFEQLQQTAHVLSTEELEVSDAKRDT